ncbi:MAG: DUF6263 family protein [Bacteroidales bacterium]
MIRKILLNITVFLFLTSGIYSQEKILLRFNPQEGLSYISEYDMNTVIDQEFMGIDQQIRMNMLMRTETRVEESSDLENLLSMSYERLAIETVTPMTSLSIDTDANDDQPGIEYLRLMTKKNFEITVNKLGEIESVEGLEKIISEITEKIEQDNPAAQSYKNTLDDAFGVDNIKNNFRQTTPAYPENEVGIGDKWSYDQLTRTAQFEFKTRNTSEIKDIKANLVLIQTNSSIETPGNKTIQIEGITANVTMKGNQVAEVSVDRVSGVPLKGVIKQDIAGELILDMSDQGMQYMNVPMKISTRIEFTVSFE